MSETENNIAVELAADLLRPTVPFIHKKECTFSFSKA